MSVRSDHAHSDNAAVYSSQSGWRSMNASISGHAESAISISLTASCTSSDPGIAIALHRLFPHVRADGVPARARRSSRAGVPHHGGALILVGLFARLSVAGRAPQGVERLRPEMPAPEVPTLIRSASMTVSLSSPTSTMI